MVTAQSYLEKWLEYQKVSSELETMKPVMIAKLIKQGDKEANGYSLSLSKRPNFSQVTLETARLFDAVHKVPDTKKLNQYLKKGKDVPGTSFTPYISIQKVA